MPTNNELTTMVLVTLGTMFAVNVLAATSPQARRIIRGASAQSAGNGQAA